MTCPLCGQRKARRACPALAREICAICCGTKRLTEIPCPDDCPYLASARVHPPAATQRQRERDATHLTKAVRDFDRRQSDLFLMFSRFLAAYEAPEFQAPLDEDVSQAVEAMAATLETASRGVIYEHRAASLPAERLITAMKARLAEATQNRGGSALERDAAMVLRRIAELVRDTEHEDRGNRRAYFDLLKRVIRKTSPADRTEPPAPAGPRLIVP